MVKRVGKYELGRTLGDGTFGKVKSANNVETGEGVAIKILDKEKIHQQNMGEQIRREVAIMRLVKHKHVVNLIEVLASSTKIFLVMETVTGGELFDEIVAAGRFDEPTARDFFRQLISGVEYCHKQGVCHRDLKPENLLLNEHGKLKISDFGLSAMYELGTHDNAKPNLLHTTCGTSNYVAPEVLANKGYDGFIADIWSCGVILYVLLAGFQPFEASQQGLFHKIMKADYTIPSWFSPGAKSVIDQILVPDPAKRINIPSLKSHPWFTEGGYVEDDTEDVPVPQPKKEENPFQEAEETNSFKKQANARRASLDESVYSPESLNAFELITMFEREEQAEPPAAEVKDQKYTRWQSHTPPTELIDTLCNALKAMAVRHTSDYTKFKIKIDTLVEENVSRPILCTVQIIKMAPGAYLVDWRHGQGDIMDYYKLYKDSQEACRHTVHGETPRVRRAINQTDT